MTHMVPFLHPFYYPQLPLVELNVFFLFPRPSTTIQKFSFASLTEHRAHNMSALIEYQNLRGVRTKLKTFQTNLLNTKAHFFCLTETWLNSDFHSTEYISNNFISHRRDRSYQSTGTTRGGGCWILHKPSIDSVRRYDFESNIDFVENCRVLQTFCTFALSTLRLWPVTPIYM